MECGLLLQMFEDLDVTPPAMIKTFASKSKYWVINFELTVVAFTFCVLIMLLVCFQFLLTSLLSKDWSGTPVWAGSTKRVTSQDWSSFLQVAWPLPSSRRHLTYSGCLDDKREIIRAVLCCVVYGSCTQWYAHTRAVLKDSAGLGLVFCVFV